MLYKRFLVGLVLGFTGTGLLTGGPSWLMAAGPASNSGQSAVSGNQGGASAQPAPGSGSSGSLLAEGKSAVYGAMAEGMDEIAAELSARHCVVVFNLPVTAQDAANVAVIKGSLASLNKIAKEADGRIGSASQAQKDLCAVRTFLIRLEDLQTNSSGVPKGNVPALAATGSASPAPSAAGGSGVLGLLGTVAGAASNVSTIGSAVSAVLSTLAQFKNQSTNSSGTVGLDPTTVNGLMTVALLKHQVKVYDFSRSLPDPNDLSRSEILSSFDQFRKQVTQFHEDVLGYTIKVGQLTAEYELYVGALPNGTNPPKKATESGAEDTPGGQPAGGANASNGSFSGNTFIGGFFSGTTFGGNPGQPSAGPAKPTDPKKDPALPGPSPSPSMAKPASSPGASASPESPSDTPPGLTPTSEMSTDPVVKTSPTAPPENAKPAAVPASSSEQKTVAAILVQAKLLVALLQQTDTQLQAQLGSLLGLPAGGQSNAGNNASANGAASAPAQPAVASPLTNLGPIAQFALAERWLARARNPSDWKPTSREDAFKNPPSKGRPETCLLTCRLVSADATETTVNRYLLENYTVSSAITTLQVDGFALDGQCLYAAAIENRGASLYWFSRVKDSAQMSPAVVNAFPWFFRRPRQPQIATTREESPTENVEQRKYGEFRHRSNEPAVDSTTR